MPQYLVNTFDTCVQVDGNESSLDSSFDCVSKVAILRIMKREYFQRQRDIEISTRFGDNELTHTYKTKNSEQTVTIPYGEITKNVRTYTEENEWLRNVGILWLALGFFTEILPVFVQQHELSLPFWSLVGAVCYLVYLRSRTHFTEINANRFNIQILKNDSQHDAILKEVFARRAAHIMNSWGKLDLDEDPAYEIEKYRELVKDEVITVEEGEAFIARIRAHEKVTAERTSSDSLESPSE